MTIETISRALCLIDQRYVIEAIEAKKERQPHGRTGRKIWRTVLIAAVISAFFAVTAFAVGYSIHQRRQQELRELMQIEENKVASYEEYPVETVEENAEGYTVALLSSAVNDQFVEVYFNLSPAEDYIENFGSISIMCSQGSGWRLCAPVPRDRNLEYNREIDTEKLNPEDFLYDSETKTLTMECSFSLNDIDTDEPFTTVVVRWPEKTELGSFTFNVSDSLETRTCLFSQPVEFSGDGAELSGRVLGIVLHPTGATWLVDSENKEALYQGSADVEAQTLWLNTLDEALSGTLNMSDGTSFEIYSGESSSLEDGIIKCYTLWNVQTIDIDKVSSISLCGETIELD
jgi:hypothetical protein